jgi:diguanylate cyclase
MADAPTPIDPATARAALRPGSLRSLPRRTYRFRVLGMGLAFLPLAVVLIEIDAPWLSWSWIIFAGVLWPHVAYLAAIRSRDPFRAELRNFVIDSIMAGSWAPLMHFNALPSALLLTVVTADKVNSGIRKLWLHSLPGMALAMLVVACFTGFAWRPQTSMPVLLACLPILVIHTIAVSLSSYQLVRRVQRQNLQLEALSRRDALTALDSRQHFEHQAEALLLRSRTDALPASLLLIDIDHFKSINDRHGHAAGDDVLRGIAELLRRTVPADGHAGRLGGDEFAVALPAPATEAARIAEQLRAAVEQLQFPRYRELQASISIGLAQPVGESDLRSWIEAADRALYRAKRSGRNRALGTEGGNDDDEGRA